MTSGRPTCVNALLRETFTTRSGRHPQGVGRPTSQPSRRRLLPTVPGLHGLLGVLLIALLTGLPVLSGPAASAPPATSATVDDAQPGLTLDAPLEPAILTESTGLVVTIRVTAGGTALPASTQLSVRLQPDVLTSRYAVSRWAKATGTSAPGQTVAQGDLGSDLAAGESRVVTLTAPAGSLPLSAQDPWGPRSVSLVLTGQGRTLDVARTFLVWGHPAPQDQPTRVTLVVPVVADSADPRTGAMSRTDLTRAAQPGGRLDATLTAADQPGVVLALDPLLLNTAIDPPGAGPTPTPDPQAQDWVARVARVVAGHDTLVLGYADPDVAALAHADQADLLTRSQSLGVEVTRAAIADETGLRADIAFPPDGTIDRPTLQAYQQIDRGVAVIVSGSAMPPRRSQNATVGGRADLSLGDTTIPALVTDPGLSSAMALVGDPVEEGGGALGVQLLLADGAALTREMPGRSRHVLVVTPRDWQPTPGNGQAAVRALTQTPWTASAGLQSLVDAEPGPARLAPVVSDDQRAAWLPAFGLRDVASTLAQTESLVTVLADPSGASRTASAQAVSLASFQWRSDLDEWRTARRTFARTPQDLRSAVHVVPGSPVTQVSRNVRLPVAVQNDAPQAVRVVLDVTPRSSRLVVPNPVTLDVPPGSRAVGYVPVRGVGNGDTAVSVQLRLTNGVPLGEPATIPVQVRADWESKGAWAFAGTVGVVLLFGLTRSVRRGTREARLTKADQEALAEAAEADTVEADTGRVPAGPGAADPPSPPPQWQVPRETSADDGTAGGR